MSIKPYYSNKEIYLFDEKFFKKIMEFELDESIEEEFKNCFKMLKDSLPFSSGILAVQSPINKKDILAFLFEGNERLEITGYFNNVPIIKLVFLHGEKTLKDVIEAGGNDNTSSNDTEIKKLFMKLFISLVLELPKLDMKNISNYRNKKFREQRKEELFTLYKNKEYGYMLKKMPPMDGYFEYKEMESGIKIIRNGFNRRIMTVPSAMYPMPNTRMKPRLFTPENTEDFTDSFVSDSLNGIEFLPGRCYTNAEKIVKILWEEYKFYAGWVFVFGQAVHHAWVVKGNSIIDVANTRKDILLASNPEKSLSKQEYAKLFYKYYKEDLPFKEKYPYGKVAWNKIYIGVESSYKEAVDSFSKLMSNYPAHPDYLNIDNTGGNETLKYMYQEIRKNQLFLEEV